MSLKNRWGITIGVLATCLNAWAADAPNVSPHQVAPQPGPQQSVAPEPKGSSIYAKVVRSVVLVECLKKESDGKTSKGLGSGSIMASDGLILTNYHVVEGADRCYAALKPPGLAPVTQETPRYALRLIARDPTKDLAFATMVNPPAGLVPLQRAALNDIEVGQEVHAIGHPKGNYWTYTQGPISQIRLQVKGIPPVVADMIQTQTPISPGNSGGPLFSDSGALVGVVTYQGQDIQNVNFAVAVSEVERFITRIKNGTHKEPEAVATKGGSASADASGADGSAKCEGPKKLGEERSKKAPGKVVSLDIGCTNRANGVMFVPDDPKEERILYVSTMAPEPGGERYFDKRYYIDPSSGNILRSWHDVDRDGKPDFIGFHKNGEEEPSQFVAFSASVRP